MNPSNHLNSSPDAQNTLTGPNGTIALQLWFLRRYREVSIVLMLNILAFGINVFSFTYSPDDFSFLLKGCNLIASGRWASHFLYNYLFMKNYLPVLSPLIGMTVMILAGFELTRLWRIRNFFHRILVIGFFSLHPYLLDMYYFRINIVTVPWAYYLAILALSQRKGWVASILLCFSLGIYQAVLGTAACTWILTLLFRLQTNGYQFNKSILWKHLRGWIWIILGILAYFLIMKITLLGVQANSRIEAGFFGDDPLRNLLKYSFILFLRLSFIPEYVIPWIPKIGVFICVLFGTGILLIQSRLRLWIILIILALPYVAICHMLPLANPDVPWRISFGLIVLVAGLLTMILQHKKLHRAGVILGLLMIISFVIVDNARMFELYIQNQRDIAMSNRIACRIESLDGYTPGMKFVVVGDTATTPLTWNREFSAQTIRDLTCYYSQNRFGLAGCFENPWSKYDIFTNYLQLPIFSAGPEMEKAARQWIQTKKCQPWPHSSSTFIFEDTIILFLGPS